MINDLSPSPCTQLVVYRIENFLKTLISNDCSLVMVMASTRVRVRVSAPGPRIRPMVRVHPGVAAVAIQALHDLGFEVQGPIISEIL